MLWSEQEWKRIRMRVWNNRRIRGGKAQWLANLEYGNPGGFVKSLAELTRVASWAGRTVRLYTSGLLLRFDGSKWRTDDEL